MEPLPTLLKLKEFQREYNVSHGQTYREIAAGRLKVRKIGRATRVARVDADDWAANLPTKGGE